AGISKQGIKTYRHIGAELVLESGSKLGNGADPGLSTDIRHEISRRLVGFDDPGQPVEPHAKARFEGQGGGFRKGVLIGEMTHKRIAGGVAVETRRPAIGREGRIPPDASTDMLVADDCRPGRIEPVAGMTADPDRFS